MNRLARTFLLAIACGLLHGCSGNSSDDQTRAVLKDAQAAYARGDYATAAQGFRLLADQGNARAEFFLGGMYLSGSGVKQDFAQSLKLEQAAAEQGSAEAQYTLGQIYESGNPVVTRDKTQALFWYGLSASSGDEQAIRKKAGLEDSLSADQIENAHQLEKQWILSHKR